nr:immunoglobulin heavy chain junction region [Macaca mulatta]
CVRGGSSYDWGHFW